MTLDASHDPELRSWVESANQAGCDFPIQNLPTGDEVVLRGYCQRDGAARIGFGECRAVVEPAPG